MYEHIREFIFVCICLYCQKYMHIFCRQRAAHVFAVRRAAGSACVRRAPCWQRMRGQIAYFIQIMLNMFSCST
jgi:hypothetical protein